MGRKDQTMIGPIEKELTRRYLAAKKKLDYDCKDEKEREYWRGKADALVEAARYCEGLEFP